MPSTIDPSANVSGAPMERDELAVFTEVRRHADIGFNETQRRAIGKNRVGSISFNEADELFRGWIDENSWPYDALLFDPRVFTFIFEKTSRLIASKPRGHLVPRQSSDIIAAKINNAILETQWDTANYGGTMISKWAMMDMNTRKYGAAFGMSKWRYEQGNKGQILYDGPEFRVLNNRDCAHDMTATAIENCNWFQVREYPTFQQLEAVNDKSKGKPFYKNLDRLREAILKGSLAGGDTRGSNWLSRNRQISRLDPDPTGKDYVYKTVEIVTEYRRDRWITFAPRHGVVLRDIDNPYKNNELPIVMLRYYAIDDDLYGLSEIESIKSLQKAINALLCQYVDEINQKLYTPIAVGPGVRQHTLEWGKGARWMMNNPMTDFRLVEPNSNAAQLFQGTYSTLVSAMMNALGESSLGVSNLGPMQRDKTATEVRSLMTQSNARDNFNQIFLSEALERQMKLWYSMNQTLLFTDPEKKFYVLRVVGQELIRDFQEEELDQMTVPDVAYQLLMEQPSDTSAPQPANMEILQQEIDKMKIPKFPINRGTKTKPKFEPKMKLYPNGKLAEIQVEPADLEGQFDFVIDVKSMMDNADDLRKQARQSAISLLVSNPNVIALLQQEGYQPKFKELFVNWLEDMGFTDADKYFAQVTQENQLQMPGGQPTQGQTSPQPNQPPETGAPEIASQIAGMQKIFPLDRNANVYSPFSQFGQFAPPTGGVNPNANGMGAQ